MKISSISPRKRSALTTVVLLAGVAFSGLVSAFIESPQGENEFLHEHLEIPQIQTNLNWESLEFDLPEPDKVKISKIIPQTERPLWADSLRQILTDKALDGAQANMCTSGTQICIFPVRVNRQLSTVHLNKDLRVANVQEISRRINLKVTADTPGLELKDISDETRVLSFYQTQDGWVQNRSAIVATQPLSFEAREDQFRTQFEQPYVGLNYYPASASWAEFWEEFPRLEIEADLEKAKALNVNSLRIFLTHAYFDAETTRADGLSKLDEFLNMCEARGLAVLVTLFDLRPNYTLSNWDADITHIDNVLPRIAAHKAVLGIDLKNQPDLDFETWGQGRVEAWLTVMARHIQTHYPHLPVSTGWSKAERATRLKDVFDFVTYHEYKDPKDFEKRLRGVIAEVGDKPVMITELGSTIWHPPFIKNIQENKQAARLENQLNQASQAGGVFVWTLKDFDHVSSDVVGPLPWRRAQQKHFGLIRKDGTLRPAAEILKSFGERSQQQSEKPTTQSPL